MTRSGFAWTLLSAVLAVSATRAEAALSGYYMEARTCQVYTGPCFANGEDSLMGKNAILAWRINRGEQQGVDLSGLKVVVVVNASDTLGFQGMANAEHLKSVILVDAKADPQQREALVQFARKHAGRAGSNVVRISTAPIDFQLDTIDLTAQLSAGKEVALSTRKARPGDCICSNESAYYPPLASLRSFVPGVTLEGSFRGRSLGTRWSIPDTRSAYMGTFNYQ